MKPILEIRNISKSYRIRHRAGGHPNFRESLLNSLRFERFKAEDFLALDDVSFDVQRGETVGIIGRNGSGKSTLLKILSKITPPTRGTITSRGRIASLLEVGTGFHAELTGRENIFFNGSLLGMKRREIVAKFDEIVDFSGVEKFLDTALKHYSSGMQLRLAFAVAAFLEPEVLVIDEVLAVGDAEFQKKCLGKMEDVARSGRTVLFVSHNMQTLNALCTKGVCLQNGKLVFTGTMVQTIDHYLRQSSSWSEQEELMYRTIEHRQDPDFRLMRIAMFQDGMATSGEIVNGRELEIEIHYRLKNPIDRFRVFLDVTDQLGTVLFRTFHDEDPDSPRDLEPGDYVSRLTLPANFLAPLSYDFRFLFGSHNVRMMEPTDGVVLRVTVQQTGVYNRAYNGQHTAGLLSPVLPWTIERIQTAVHGRVL